MARRSLFRQHEQVSGTQIFIDDMEVALAEQCGRKYASSTTGNVDAAGVLTDNSVTFVRSQVNDYIVFNGTTNSGVHQITAWQNDHQVQLAGTTTAENPVSYDIHKYKNLEDDLNYIRSQLNSVMGGGTWIEDPCTNLCDMSNLIPKRPNYVGETSQYAVRPGTVTFSLSNTDQTGNVSSGAPAAEYTDNTTTASPGDSLMFTDDNTMSLAITGGFYPADKGTLYIKKDGVTIGELDLEAAWTNDGCQYEEEESDVGTNPNHTSTGVGTDVINLTNRRCMNDNTDGYGAFWPAYQIASMNATVTLDAGVNGLITVEHSVDGSQSYTYGSFWLDTTSQSITANAPTVSSNTISNKYLSGIPYAGAGSTFDLSVTNSDALFDRGYPANPLVLLLSEFNASNQTPSYTDLGLSTPTAITDTIGTYNYTVTVGMADFRDMDARAKARFYNVFGNATSADSAAGIFRIDTYGNTSDDTHEYFDDEQYRFIGNSTDENTTFNDTTIDEGDSNWDETVSVLTQTDVDGDIGLVCYDGSLKYPDTDHSSGYVPAGPDYSGATGSARYYRVFLGSGAFNQGKIRFVGWSNALSVIQGSTISVHLRLPNCSDYSNGNTATWQDLSVDETIYGGNGCLGVGSSGEEVAFSFGTTSSSSYGNRVIIRITATGSFSNLQGVYFEPTV